MKVVKVFEYKSPKTNRIGIEIPNSGVTPFSRYGRGNFRGREKIDPSVKLIPHYAETRISAREERKQFGIAE